MPGIRRKRPGRSLPGQDLRRPAGSDQRAPRDRDLFRVAAFGDSLMWGQGLRRNERFVTQIVAALSSELGKQATISADTSRSGAQIRARADQRMVFQDRFPSLFTGRSDINSFINGTNESPATGLYGEIPAPFPTIRGQIALVTDTLGRAIDVALVDGGVNDIALEDIINPQVANGEFIEEWDGKIRAVAHEDVLELIGRVRRKCPNAVIMYFGFFAPLSYKSDPVKIRALMKHEYDDSLGWWFNENILQQVDINALIQEAMTRSVWMQGRWQYWTRKAVVDANRDASVRGPGVLFVPSGFTQENAVFGKKPFLHEDYTHPTTDTAQAERERRCPRTAQLSDLTQLLLELRLLPGSLLTNINNALMRRLLGAIDGPTKLKIALKDALTDGASNPERARLVEALSSEVGRIQHALIASVSHPNSAGAKSYADNAMARFRRHREITASINQVERPGPLQPPLPTLTETLDEKLQRYRLRGVGSLHADAGHLDVDSLAVRVITAPDSDQNFAPDMWLVVTTQRPNQRSFNHEYMLNFKYGTFELFNNRVFLKKLYAHFEPGTTTRFTVDTIGGLHLDEIIGFAIVIGPDPLEERQTVGPHGTIWRPQTVQLEINGQQVTSISPNGQQLGPTDALDLSYPTPRPNFSPPRMKRVEVATVPPLIIGPVARPAVPQNPSQDA